MKDKAQYGYIGMTADGIHIGHIRALEHCKELCHKLIVGVMSDESVEDYKGKKPMMSFDDRIDCVYALKMVDVVWKQDTFEFPHQVWRMKSFHGEDLIIFDSPEHKRKGADVIVPKTERISSTKIKGSYNSQLPF